MQTVLPLLEPTDFPALKRGPVNTLQVNLGYRCNQSCMHCHVNAGPYRTEMMQADNLALIPKVLAVRRISALDLTGGAPELHPGFRDLVRAAHGLGVRVIDRCNLTVMFEPGQEDLAEFLRDHSVEVVASLPCYSADNVDRQRGKGVFEKSIAALWKLNTLGYGQEDSPLRLHLVYNPLGPNLPPNQTSLEAAYKQELRERFGIVFHHLFVLTNMPIQRFGSWLLSRGEFHNYLRLLKDHFRAGNTDQVMCRSLVSVDWQGYLYDCDFNQQLRLPLNRELRRAHLRDLLEWDPAGSPIRVADHCYGCTAGQGSSCGGALQTSAGAEARPSWS